MERLSWDKYLDMQWKCKDLLKGGWAPFHLGSFKETLWVKLGSLLIEGCVVLLEVSNGRGACW